MNNYQEIRYPQVRLEYVQNQMNFCHHIRVQYPEEMDRTCIIFLRFTIEKLTSSILNFITTKPSMELSKLYPTIKFAYKNDFFYGMAEYLIYISQNWWW